MNILVYNSNLKKRDEENIVINRLSGPCLVI